jgi:hypothetical protein
MSRASIWEWNANHSQLCQVIEIQTLWSETTCRVWLPGRDSVTRKFPDNVLREDQKLQMWHDQADCENEGGMSDAEG